MKYVGYMVAALLISMEASALDVQKALYNYVLPCAASVAVGTLLDADKGQTMGLVVCAGTSTYAAMQEFSDTRAATMRDLNKMSALLKAHNERVAVEVTKDLGGKIEDLTRDRQAFLADLRAQVQVAVSDQSVFMSEQMAERLKTAMSSPEFIPDLMARINARVKAEVASEYDLRRASIIRETVEDVLNSITVKAVAAPEGRVVTPGTPKAKKKQTQYEDE